MNPLLASLRLNTVNRIQKILTLSLLLAPTGGSDLRNSNYPALLRQTNIMKNGQENI
jgi:hypothetical protein